MKNRKSSTFVILSLVLVIGLIAGSVLIYQKSKSDRPPEVAEILTDAAGNAADKIRNKEVGDDFFAKYTLKFTSKQEHINELLKTGGSNYRVTSIEVGAEVPPKVVLVIQKQADK